MNYYRVEAKSVLFFFIPEMKEPEFYKKMVAEIIKKLDIHSKSKN